MFSFRDFFGKYSDKKKKTSSFSGDLLSLDKENIDQIAREEASLDQIESKIEKKRKQLDAEIEMIQRSTRTALPSFSSVHNRLRAKYRWYYKWHLFSEHETIHVSILAVCIIAAFFSVYGSLKNGLGQSFAAGTPTLTSVVPGSGSTLGGSNVTITGTNFATYSSVGSGGTVTTDGAYTVHTFTSDGTFSVPSGRNVEVLVVGGGGGGGGTFGGGGGAGGLIYNAALPVTTDSYSVTVGQGGNGGYDNASGSNGGNSVFSSLTAVGGGGGAYYYGSYGIEGSNGGSGGGGGAFWGSY